MKKLRRFKCNNCSEVKESLVADDIKACFCDKCNGVALRTISAGKYFNNTVGKSPATK